MFKPVIVATAVIAIGGSSIVFAQQSFEEHNGFNAQDHYRPSAADMAAFTDARIAALRAGLQLTPDQAKNWPAFEQALRDLAQLRMQYVRAREARQQDSQAAEQAQTTTNPFERLQHRADNLGKTGAALKKVADAGTPLYESLTDAQKQRFTRLGRMLRPRRLGRMMGHGAMMRGGMMREEGDEE
jgi:hypothetical protein